MASRRPVARGRAARHHRRASPPSRRALSPWHRPPAREHAAPFT